jgi:glucose uptake protein
MILPASYLFTVILLILSLLCWGSWANTLKLAGKWRYELYCFDFAAGAFLIAAIAAMTFGSLGWDGFSFLDDIRNSGKRQELFAFLGGSAFNLGNMLLLAAVSIAGLSVAFPVGLGTALIVSVIWLYFGHPGGNPAFLALGSLAVSCAVVLTILAYRSRTAAAAAAARKQTATPVKGKPVRSVSSSRAILLAVAGGLMLGCAPQLVDAARETENGLGPYAILFIFTAAIVASTFVFSLFFMNLPVQGQPVDFGEYFKGSARQHGLGVLGGVLFSVGTLASLIAFRAEGVAHASPAISYAIEYGAPVVSALWGLIVWKEFAGANSKDKTFMFVMLVLFAAGIAAVAAAPQFTSGS